MSAGVINLVQISLSDSSFLFMEIIDERSCNYIFNLTYLFASGSLETEEDIINISIKLTS
jgi:hypothetical protein